MASDEELWNTFHIFDKDAKGYITKDQVSIIAQLGGLHILGHAIEMFCCDLHSLVSSAVHFVSEIWYLHFPKIAESMHLQRQPSVGWIRI